MTYTGIELHCLVNCSWTNKGRGRVVEVVAMQSGSQKYTNYRVEWDTGETSLEHAQHLVRVHLKREGRLRVVA